MAMVSELGVALVLVLLASICFLFLLARLLASSSSAVATASIHRIAQSVHRPSVCQTLQQSHRKRRRAPPPPKPHVHPGAQPDAQPDAQPTVLSTPPLSNPDDDTFKGSVQHCPIASALLRLDATCAPLTRAYLLSLDAVARERELGERLYACVRLIETCRSGKVTGMLLELDDKELLEILGAGGDPRARAATLLRWVEEANEVLAVAAADEARPGRQAVSPLTVPWPVLDTPRSAIEEWQIVERKGGRSRRRAHSAHSPDSVVS